MELIAKIPLGQIKKIVLYQNTRRQYISQVKARTGADYVINGGIYDFAKFEPHCNVKVDGVVESDPGYTEFGYAWNKGPDISYKVLPSDHMNYLGCVGAVLNGKAQKLRYNRDMGGRRQRSAIGIADGALILYACNKSNSKTPEALQNYMLQNGWKSGLMLDGGGSTQAIFPNGTIKSSENKGKGRVVQNYILVYTSGNTPDVPSKPSTKPHKATTDVCPYKQPLINIKSGSRGEGAKWVQWHLNKAMGLHLSVDGIFGSRSVAVLKSFQKQQKLTADGICGRGTRSALIRKVGN